MTRKSGDKPEKTQPTFLQMMEILSILVSSTRGAFFLAQARTTPFVAVKWNGKTITAVWRKKNVEE